MTFDSINENEFANAVRSNQRALHTSLKKNYDFIVCGAGSSGSVVAARLAENPDTQVLMFEAGAAMKFQASPNRHNGH